MISKIFPRYIHYYDILQPQLGGCENCEIMIKFMDKITISVFTDIGNPFSMTQCDQADDDQCNLVIVLFAPYLYNSYLLATISFSPSRGEARWGTPAQ